MDVNALKLYDAQVAVVGSMLIDPRCIGPVLEKVKASDFSYENLRTLFKGMQHLFSRGEPVDPIVLQQLVGAEYADVMADVMRRTPTAANVAAYCNILRDESDLARLKDLAEKINSASTVGEARKALTGSLEYAAGRTGWDREGVHDALNDLLDRLGDPTPPKFITWGIPALDSNLQVKAERGSFIILGAESSVGKTAFALQLAFSLALSGRRVGFYSLETDKQTAYDRVFVQRAKIKLRDLRAKRVSDADVKKLMDIGDYLNSRKNIKLDIIECGGASAAQIRTDILIHRYDVVLVDYVQLLTASGGNRAEIVANISMQLRTIAQQLGCIVIGLSQLTPKSDEKKFALRDKEDLRESRQLIHDADVILVMSRTNADEPNFRELVIDKNKDGPLGRIALDFHPEFMEFVPHRPSPGESYDAVRRACAKADREKRAEAKKAQVTFREMTDDEDNPWPADGPSRGEKGEN